jgi:DNA-binding transcriptional ArsR family regulator
MPNGFADYSVPGVEWVATDAQRSVIEALRERESATARELAEATDLSKRHVAETLSRLHDEGHVTCRSGMGAHGADVFTSTDAPSSGVADLDVEEITNSSVWGSNTWAFAIEEVELPTRRIIGHGEEPVPTKAVSLAAFQEGPPPE